MSQVLTNTDFQNLVTNKEYKSEEEFEKEIISKLPALLKILPNQIKNQVTTTSFDKTLSNCADLIVSSNEEIPHVLLVVELKLDRMVESFHHGDYLDAVKQLHKYCQDVRSPYGILLTESICIIYDYKYYKVGYKPEKIQQIPYPIKIEDIVTRRSILEFVGHRHSSKDVYLFIIIVLILNAIGFLIKSLIQ